MELSTFFASVGADYDEVLGRLASESLIRRFLKKFPQDPAYALLQSALAEGDLPEAFRAVHTIKGTAATLGLDDLSKAASSLTEALRGAKELPPPELVLALEKAYAHAVLQIEKLEA